MMLSAKIAKRAIDAIPEPAPAPPAKQARGTSDSSSASPTSSQSQQEVIQQPETHHSHSGDPSTLQREDDYKVSIIWL